MTDAPPTRVRFVGDLHLGDGGRNDAFGANDQRLARFLEESGACCDAVVFMGDAFDLPQAFNVRRITKAHPEASEALAALCRETDVRFVRGNHDYDVDYPRHFHGARGGEDFTIGPARVMHGYQLDTSCHPERPSHFASTVAHHLVERALGFEFRVPLHEHYTTQNRVVHLLGYQYARWLRASANVYDKLGFRERARSNEAFIHYWSRAVWGDAHALFDAAAAAARAGPTQALVCGHTHLPGVVDLGDRHYINAGSWTFGDSGFAEWDGSAFSASDFETGESFGDTRYGWMLDGVDPGDFFDWWRLAYEGRLRFRAPPVGQRGPVRRG